MATPFSRTPIVRHKIDNNDGYEKKYHQIFNNLMLLFFSPQFLRLRTNSIKIIDHTVKCSNLYKQIVVKISFLFIKHYAFYHLSQLYLQPSYNPKVQCIVRKQNNIIKYRFIYSFVPALISSRGILTPSPNTDSKSVESED